MLREVVAYNGRADSIESHGENSVLQSGAISAPQGTIHVETDMQIYDTPLPLKP